MKLENGKRFPDISCPTVAGEELALPAGLERRWTAVLFYRGGW